MSDNDWPPFTKPSDPAGTVPPHTVGIVIPMRNGLRIFKLCLFSVLSLTDRPFSLVVVDNMSDLPVKKALRDLSVKHGFTVLRYDREFNFAAEVNLGLRHLFQNRHIQYGLVLNSDAVVEPFWLGNMMEAFRQPEDYGIVGPVSNTAIPEQQLPRSHVIEPTNRMVSGFCMMFRREVFEQVGGFDEAFQYGGYEDWDFCERARRAGVPMGVNREVHVTHFWKCSRRGPLYDAAMAANRQRFIQKHPHLEPVVR